MIDSDGYRSNVAIVLCNDDGRVFWARRIGTDSWQFPQGGVKKNENSELAMYRELYEETGLDKHHVEIIGHTRHWLRYDLPERYIRKNSYPLCIGQKQLWYILRLAADESNVCLDCSDSPEFDDWCWTDYWLPVNNVVFFKRKVYKNALTELGQYLIPESVPVNPAGYLACPVALNASSRGKVSRCR
ncbi:MAG TPA: RNA pyrophosphohydrolase [Crenotrichaceae bacterium]|nr:RNA pyrophosphohydrolase [Crenotrichaceae bacterium]